VRVFSGIQPSGNPTFGNYSGGFRQYVATQNTALESDGAAFFCLVDLHAITVEYDPADLRTRTLDLAALLYATGLDPARATVFAQSDVTAHPEAAWLLGAVTSYGQLGRMTQFKEKGDRQEFVSAALFDYPILMAGDILLYQADTVPIGDDQRQHLELARDIAERFNQRFGETFVVPQAVYPETGARIMDLQSPGEKMGKTGSSEAGTVRLLDPPDVIRKKFRSAVTDSGRDVRRADDKPGVTNLIEILATVRGVSPETVEEEMRSARGYGDLKVAVAEAVSAELAPVQERYRAIREDGDAIENLLAACAGKARAMASETLADVREAMGVGPARR
jgi:tryptophanyl-tRNA synthetase